MASIDLETATIRMYEDASLRGEITDQPAQILLSWGAGQIKQLAAEACDEEAFEDQFKTLRKLMKSMNRFTARRREMDTTEQREYLHKRILERAQELDMPCTEERLNAYQNQQSFLDEEANIRALIALCEPPQQPDVTNPDQPHLIQ